MPQAILLIMATPSLSQLRADGNIEAGMEPNIAVRRGGNFGKHTATWIL
jgi:hypothetical protein